jgi:hypothetical protein
MEETRGGGNRKFREDAKSQSCGQAAAHGAHHKGTTAGRWDWGAHGTQACEANGGLPLIANMPITEILHGLGILAKLNIWQAFMKCRFVNKKKGGRCRPPLVKLLD